MSATGFSLGRIGWIARNTLREAIRQRLPRKFGRAQRKVKRNRAER